MRGAGEVSAAEHDRVDEELFEVRLDDATADLTMALILAAARPLT